jgi:hypothetical protein
MGFRIAGWRDKKKAVSSRCDAIKVLSWFPCIINFLNSLQSKSEIPKYNEINHNITIIFNYELHPFATQLADHTCLGQ